MITKIIQLRAQQTARAPKVCFIHVPKCGGSSVTRALAASYSYSDRLLVPNWYLSLRASQSAASVLGRPMMDVRETVLIYKLAEARAKFITGHIVCRPRTRESFADQWQFVTVLRDPVTRWISEFVYNTYGAQQWAKNDLPLEQYMESPVGVATARRYIEYFSHWTVGDPIEDSHVQSAALNLREFAAVGILERLPAFAERLHRIVGRPVAIPQVNVSPRAELSDEIMRRPDVLERIRELCASDIAVYERVTSIERLPVDAPEPGTHS